MRKPFTTFNSSMLGLPLLLFICLGLLGGGFTAHKWFPGKQARWQIEPRLINNTAAIRVEHMTVTDGPYPDVKLTLLNQSTQDINGYILVIGTLYITSDFASVGEYLKPGATRTETIPLQNFQAAADHNPDYKGELSIAAVSFAGLTGEGVPKDVKRLIERHQGIKEHINVLLPILKATVQSARANAVDALLVTEAKTAEIATYSDNIRLSPNYRAGREWVKEELGTKLKIAKAKGQRSQAADINSVEELIAYYEQILARL